MPTKLTRALPFILTAMCIICLNAFYDCGAAEKEETVGGLGSRLKIEGDPIYLILDTSFAYGSISGFTQAGLGGGPGTGTSHRPEIKRDLGIDSATTGKFSLELGWKQQSFDMAAHLIDLEGDNTLDRTLIFHGQTYLPGTRVESELKTNWYEVAYRYRLLLNQSENSPTPPKHQESLTRARFVIAPTIAMAFWDFGVQVKQNGAKNERSYSKITPRLGVLLEWNPWPKLSFVGQAVGSIPVDGMVHIYTVGLAAEYDLIQRNRFNLGLRVGIAYDHIDFKDQQTFPNKVRIDMGPMVIGGLTVISF
jgi:hypothetical protein